MNIFLKGANVNLRPLEIEDAPAFWTWFANREITKHGLNSWLLPFSLPDTEIWVRQVIQDKQAVTLGVVDKMSNELIGYTSVYAMSNINKSGEYFIFIGDKNYWGKGIGSEVTRMMIDYSFLSLNLHRIMLTVSSIDTNAVRAFTKSGFHLEGVMREASYRDGQYLDKIVMGLIRPDWEDFDQE